MNRRRQKRSYLALYFLCASTFLISHRLYGSDSLELHSDSEDNHPPYCLKYFRPTQKMPQEHLHELNEILRGSPSNMAFQRIARQLISRPNLQAIPQDLLIEWMNRLPPNIQEGIAQEIAKNMMGKRSQDNDFALLDLIKKLGQIEITGSVILSQALLSFKTQMNDYLKRKTIQLDKFYQIAEMILSLRDLDIQIDKWSSTPEGKIYYLDALRSIKHRYTKEQQDRLGQLLILMEAAS